MGVVHYYVSTIFEEDEMKKLVALMVSVFFMGATGLALAQDAAPAESTPTAKPAMKGTHPRIHEIEARLKEQHKRIAAGVKAKKLTKDEAKGLHAKVKAVGDQMKDFIKQNGKMDLTEDQQKKLNASLDETSKTIAGEKQDNAAAPAGDTASATPAQ
jgi:hypothetical protein